MRVKLTPVKTSTYYESDALTAVPLFTHQAGENKQIYQTCSLSKYTWCQFY